MVVLERRGAMECFCCGWFRNLAQAPFFTHLVGQARHKTTATQNKVAKGQGKEIWVLTGNAWLADEDMGLGRFKRNLQGFRLFQRHHLRHHRLRGASTLSG